MKINVNTDELVHFTKKLEKLNRSAFPVAVRQTLNTQAFQTKKKELIDEYNKAFTVRNRGFAKAFSKVNPATGFDIRRMQASVGMSDRDNKGKTNQAGENMEQQQVGGRIGGRTFIPTRFARVGSSNSRAVKKSMRLSELNKEKSIKKAPRTRFADGNGKQKFVRTAAYARVKRKKFIRTDTMLYKVGGGTSGKYNYRFRKLSVSITPIYSIKKGRSVSINSPNLFTQRAALRVNKRADRIFKEHAEKQFKRALQ